VRTRSFTVAFLLFDEVELLDVAGAIQALSQAGRQWNWRPFKVVTVAAKAGSLSTRSQLRIEAATDLASCPEAEIVLVPGGYGARAASEDAATVGFVRERGARAELVGALGQGTLVLARAGLLDGLEVSAAPELGGLLTEAAPDARLDFERRVIEAGKLITAQSGVPSIELGLRVIQRLLGEKLARAAAAALGHEMAEGAPLRVEILPPQRSE
jgi:transcriptional regulator GlxA family with amidase domain